MEHAPLVERFDPGTKTALRTMRTRRERETIMVEDLDALS
jgi:hypothetical protein